MLRPAMTDPFALFDAWFAEARASELGAEVKVSLTHTRGMAGAVAVLS